MATKPKYSRIAQLKTAEEFQKYAADAGAKIPFDAEITEESSKIFHKKIHLKSGKTIGNSLCILPMEGWDGTSDGKPTDFTRRRWENFAKSGAKLLFGCEAVAVRHDGRANSRQLVMNEANLPDFVELFQLLQNTHKAKFGTTDDLVIGLQLTHSGRFCKPNDDKKFESKILYHHPVLDKKFGLTDESPLITDEEIDQLIEDYVKAAVLAQKAGFQFIDVKHCHGYLGHEFLSAHTREGKYGGSFENRTRFLKNIVAGINEACPGLEMGIRFSAFDFVPFKKGDDGEGEPDLKALSFKEGGIYKHGFGTNINGSNYDLTETKAFLELAQTLGIQMICVTGGSPYYNPHLMRPAIFPPSDGYNPPEEPLVGVARQIAVCDELKQAFPEMVIIGSAYTYLQDWLPNVAQNVLRNNMADMVGFGRMVLSYPEMPDDMLNNRPMARKMICRTFSDCTTAPRNGLISGCYPLDLHYKNLPEATILKELKHTL
jgi:NADPH2 dehydrogenase